MSKKIAEIIRDTIGADRCWVDKYDFEPAYKTLDEIYSKLGNTGLFVLLISQESLDSDWVQKEINKAKEFLNDKRIYQFACYIVDETPLSELPNWMVKEECYNLKYFSNPIFIAHDVQKKMKRIMLEHDPVYQLEQTIFVGRNDKIDEFERKMFSADGTLKLAMITSGRKGVGRKKFASKCIENLGKGSETIPYTISLDSKHGIEDFIVLLNQKTRQYDEETINEILMSTIEDKLDCAIKLITEIYKFHSFIFINDNKCIVRPERILADWFIDLIKHIHFPQQLGLFIFSVYAPVLFIENDYPSILHINLSPLSKSDCRKLFFKSLQQLNIENVTEKDAEFFLAKLTATPRQIFQCALTLKNHSINLVKKDIDNLVDYEDKNIALLLKELFDDNDLKDLMILLSNYEYLSNPILYKIFNDRIDAFEENLTKLLVMSLVETFGPGEEYIKLDSGIADYIRRNKLRMSSDLEILVTDIITQELAGDVKITEDLSLYLYDIKSRLNKGEFNKEVLLMPSIAIKFIIDIYDKRKWSQVIAFCDKVLNDSYNLSYYPQVIEEIRYWLCLALCRLQKQRFFEEVKHFDKYDYEFLMGFYQRNAKNYSKAEERYRKALKIRPQLSKAQRELVTTLLAQRKFADALELAKNNYESQPANTYHIYAYFRCLVRKRHIEEEDKQDLKQLISEMGNSPSPKRNALVRAMELEYNGFASGSMCKTKQLLEDAVDAMREYPNSLDIKRVVNAIQAKQGITHIEEFDENPDEY